MLRSWAEWLLNLCLTRPRTSGPLEAQIYLKTILTKASLTSASAAAGR